MNRLLHGKLWIQGLLLLVAVLLIAAAASADIIKSGTLQAASNGVNVTVRWVTEDETAVASFAVERRTGSEGAFSPIGEVLAKGPSPYEFVDHSALLKSGTVYQYRLVISFTDGRPRVFTEPTSVSHTLSGIRRTWGSIKAMFR